MPGNKSCPVGCMCKTHFKTVEHIRKVALANRGKKRSLATRHKISEAKKKLTPEQRRNMSEAQKGRVPWNLGVPMSKKQKAKLRKALKGRVNKECASGCLCLKHTMHQRHPHVIEAIRNGNIGKKRTKAQRQRISKGKLGKKFTPEHRQNLKDAWKRSKQKHINAILGQKRSRATRQKIRIAKLGKKLTSEHKKRISEGNRGHICTEETRKKLSKTHLRRDVLLKKVTTCRTRYGNPCSPFKSTKPERAVQIWLEQHKVKFLAQYHNYGTTVDFFASLKKVYIFVDGCWWHYHSCLFKKRMPNAGQLRALKRDPIITKRIQDAGHKVIRIWECEIKRKDFTKLIKENLNGI